MPGKEFGRSDDRRTLPRADRDRDHVLCDDLPEADTGIEAVRDHVDQGVVQDDFELHLRILLHEV